MWRRGYVARQGAKGKGDEASGGPPPRDHNGNRLRHVATGWADGVLTITVAEQVPDNGL
ncbi:hypothetical protein GCM10011345_36770 [Gemmobacter megaterium]|nr:hypothetical protein GCM10011345_36770 [Gemmobacter megaterium]